MSDVWYPYDILVYVTLWILTDADLDVDTDADIDG